MDDRIPAADMRTLIRRGLRRIVAWLNRFNPDDWVKRTDNVFKQGTRAVTIVLTIVLMIATLSGGIVWLGGWGVVALFDYMTVTTRLVTGGILALVALVWLFKN